jgi:hypothetical protein
MRRPIIKRAGIYLITAILISTLSGCVGKQEAEPGSNSTPSGSPAAADPTTPITSSTSPVDALGRSIRAQLDAKSYRVRIMSIAPNIKGETIVEYVAPDRIHMTNPISELIAVGSETYTRQAQGPWQKAPLDAREIVATFRDPKLLDQLTNNYDITFIGPDAIDGAPMMVYEYSPKPTSSVPQTGKTKIWIGAQDSLPKKVEVQTGSNNSVTTIIYSDYNSDIKIELPV